MKRYAAPAFPVVLFAVYAGCASVGGSGGGDAFAVMRDTTGRELGELQLHETPAGVRIEGMLRDIRLGTHAFHIHTTGMCEPPFTSAGGHFNPTGKQHGTRNPAGPHAGDLPNVSARADGTTPIDVVAAVTIAPGPTSLFDADGAALVVHAGVDDEVSDPAGNAGSRIACGVIQRRGS